MNGAARVVLALLAAPRRLRCGVQVAASPPRCSTRQAPPAGFQTHAVHVPSSLAPPRSPSRHLAPLIHSQKARMEEKVPDPLVHNKNSPLPHHKEQHAQHHSAGEEHKAGLDVEKA
jgi:hypothetical protein